MDPFLPFEFRQSARAILPFTRKNRWPLAGGLALPGLFQTHGLEFDVARFFVALICEAAVAWTALRYAGVFPVAIVGFFMLDVILAVAKHGPQSRLTLNNNRLVSELDSRTRDKLIEQNKRARLGQNFASALIFGLAGAKSFTLFAVFGGQITAVVVVGILAYFVAAVMHVWSTGYALFGLLFNFLAFRDRRAYLRPDGKAPASMAVRTYREAEFVASDAVLTPATVHRHELVHEGNRWTLRTFGFLHDDHAKELLLKQKSLEARAVLLPTIVRAQLEILESAPIQNEDVSRAQVRVAQLGIALVGLMTSSFVLGCSEPPPLAKHIAPLQLTVLLTGPLASNSNAQMPAALRDALEPAFTDSCGLLVYPLATFVRVDLDPPDNQQTVSFGRARDAGITAFVRPLIAKTNVPLLRDEIDNNMRTWRIGEHLAAETRDRRDVAARIGRALASERPATVYVTQRETGDDARKGYWSNVLGPQTRLIPVTDGHSPTLDAGAAACDESRGSQTVTPLPPAFLLYEPFYIADAPHAVPVDEALEMLRSRGRTASGAQLLTLDQDLANAETRFPLDYRFTVERAALGIVGRANHHESFEHLSRAAEKAIRTSLHPEMLSLLQQDTRFTPLSRGHHEWEDLRQALLTGDVLRLHSRHSHPRASSVDRPNASAVDRAQSRAFKITSPTSGSSVRAEVVTVTGVGAPADGSVAIRVFTNRWYTQDEGRAKIRNDGSWSFGPCYLSGRREYNSHTIEAVAIKHGKEISSDSVGDVVRNDGFGTSLN